MAARSSRIPERSGRRPLVGTTPDLRPRESVVASATRVAQSCHDQGRAWRLIGRRSLLSGQFQILLGSLILLGTALAASANSAADREFRAVMHLQPNMAHGEELFDTCRACHGKTGVGVSDGTVPAIAGQHLRVIVTALIDFRSGNRPDPRMGHFTDKYHLANLQDIADVAAYVSGLQRVDSSAHGEGQNTARGAEIFRGGCASCHGSAAEGNDRKRYPHQTSQQNRYLLSQLQDALAGRRRDMASDHAHRLEHLEPSDLTEVSEYLSRLRQ